MTGIPKEVYCIGVCVIGFLGMLTAYSNVGMPSLILQYSGSDQGIKEQIKKELMSREGSLGLDYDIGTVFDPLEEVLMSHKFSELEDIKEDANGRKPRLPECILIGERKTGTTGLLHFLMTHPLIKAPKKEVHFFDLHDNYRLGARWYVDKMPPTNSTEVTFEKSPRYFRSPWVPQRMHEIVPDVKLLLSVRDPIARAVSDFHFSLESNWSAGFEAALDTPFESLVVDEYGHIDEKFPPLARSIYVLSLQNWLKYFDKKQFHIFDGAAFITRNPVFELNRIEKFMGLKPYFTEDMFFLSKKRGFWCLKDPGCYPFGGKHHPPVQESMIKKLKAFFKPYNEQFYKLVGKNFDW